jgi:membrane protease YdiL (CAAX protease family)
MEFVQLLLLTAIVAASLVGYARGFRRVYVLHEGKVEVNRFTLLDAVLAGFLVLMLVIICFGAIGSKRSIDPRNVDTVRLIYAVVSQWGIIIGTLLILFQVRGMAPTSLFGFDKIRVRKVVWTAICFLLIALPLVFATNVAISHLLRIDPQQDSQEIVQIFEGTTNPMNKLPIVLLAVIVAPLAEEFVFRGFLYGVLKRYFGSISSMLFTGILFALMHFHLPSLLPLFVLACALTLAYELSGSLLVPMAMHALFNSLTLVMVSLAGQ